MFRYVVLVGLLALCSVALCSEENYYEKYNSARKSCSDELGIPLEKFDNSITREKVADIDDKQAQFILCVGQKIKFFNEDGSLAESSFLVGQETKDCVGLKGDNPIDTMRKSVACLVKEELDNPPEEPEDYDNQENLDVSAPEEFEE